MQTKVIRSNSPKNAGATSPKWISYNLAPFDGEMMHPGYIGRRLLRIVGIDNF
jgi:hypothetical protein